MAIRQHNLLLTFYSMAPDSTIMLHSGRRRYGYNQPGSIEAATQAFGLHVLDDAEVDYLFSLTNRKNMQLCE